MRLESYQKRRFWHDTFRHGGVTVVTEYAYGFLIPVVYVAGRGRRHPASVLASEFVGPAARSLREWQMGLISDALGSVGAGTADEPVTDPAFQKAYPTLFGFLTVTEEDGKPRTPSSLLIFTQEGQFKGLVTEKDANLQLWRSSPLFQDLLKSLEKALASGNADWRRGRDQGPPGKGRKGK